MSNKGRSFDDWFDEKMKDPVWASEFKRMAMQMDQHERDEKCFDGSKTWAGGRCSDCLKPIPSHVDTLREVFRLRKQITSCRVKFDEAYNRKPEEGDTSVSFAIIELAEIEGALL